MHDITKSVKDFYDLIGWQRDAKGESLDKSFWEDQRSVSKLYQARCRAALRRHFFNFSDTLLDAGAGALQHAEYESLYLTFKKIFLLDLSYVAMQRINASNQRFRLVGSVDAIPLRAASIDCILSVNVINHVPSQNQELAIRDMLRVLRPGGRLVVVTYNPHRVNLSKILKKFRIRRGKNLPSTSDRNLGKLRNESLYWSAVTPEWWKKFEEDGILSFYPYRFLFITDLENLIPDNLLGRAALEILYFLQLIFRKAGVRWGAYYTVVIDRREI
ncbi:class I SAM-dependent methyltransferase [Paraburkholderia tropica]|uniref:class I SAM-dependent methyltransferase n=1 Tax=Paraburkholderia tropica TaxID=92647 RepID=UPI0009438597|nr:class I SAM-dependent methyltransferase [Paraburkholderia tropica]